MSTQSMTPARVPTDQAAPDAIPGERRLYRAALEFAFADKALREHAGPPAGSAYDAKIQRWRDAYNALLKTAASCEGADHAGNEG